MSTSTIYELIGYVGSILIVVSLAMSSVIRLRIVNLIGAIVFTTYGILIGSLPVLLTNLVITGLDIFHLWRELSTRDVLGVISVAPDDPFLATFIDRYADDIATYGPPDPTAADVQFVMVRDATLAGVFLGRSLGDRRLEVLVDYVAPPFRDLRHGVSLYDDDQRRFTDLGFDTVVAVDPHEHQQGYFAEMGFEPAGDTMVKHVG